MKILSSIITLCLAAFTCFAQKIKSDLEKEGLKGNIDSIVITKYIQLNGTPVVKSFLNMQVLRFNKYGNITRESLYSNPTASFLQDPPNPRIEKPVTIIYKYDSSGKLIEKITYWGNGTPWIKKVYINNGINNQQQELVYNLNSNTVSSNKIAAYDAQGNLTEDDFYDIQNGRFAYKIIYQYKHGNLVNGDMYHKDGQKDYNEAWRYDKLNNMISHAKTYFHVKHIRKNNLRL